MISMSNIWSSMDVPMSYRKSLDPNEEFMHGVPLGRILYHLIFPSKLKPLSESRKIKRMKKGIWKKSRKENRRKSSLIQSWSERVLCYILHVAENDKESANIFVKYVSHYCDVNLYWRMYRERAFLVARRSHAFFYRRLSYDSPLSGAFSHRNSEHRLLYMHRYLPSTTKITQAVLLKMGLLPPDETQGGGGLFGETKAGGGR